MEIRKTINSWNENRKRKEAQQKYKTSKESIEYLLHKDLTTHQSVKLFQEVSEVFTLKMTQRLTVITEEKDVLEKFLHKN